MRIIKPSATLMEHNIHPYAFIEKVGRTCYKSEDYIKEGSAEKFVAGLVKREHMAMLEHEHIYLLLSKEFMQDFMFDMDYVDEELTFFNITRDHNNKVYVLSGSFRSFYDLFKKDYRTYTIEFIKRGLKMEYPLVFGCFADASFFKMYPENSCVMVSRNEFKEMFKDRGDILFKHLIHTFLFVTDRGVTHEFVRHRPASYAQESTRYCNYSKDKFGNEISVILPCFFDTGMGEMSNSFVYDTWKHSCEVAERDYFKLLEYGATPQQARTVLPNSLKTELIVTATESEWQHIVNLRYIGTTGAPHPQIKEAMTFAVPFLIIESKGRIRTDKGVK